MRSSTKLCAVLAVTLLFSLLQIGHRAEAVPQAPAVCTFQTNNYAVPGFAMTPTEGVDRAHGTISCIGSLEGRQLRAETGTIAFVFYYKSGGLLPPPGLDGCVYYTGHGVMDVTLPTDSGPLALSGPFESSGSSVAEAHGRLGNSNFQGIVSFPPDPDHLDENCVTKPLQHFLTIGQMVFTT